MSVLEIIRAYQAEQFYSAFTRRSLPFDTIEDEAAGIVADAIWERIVRGEDGLHTVPIWTGTLESSQEVVIFRGTGQAQVGTAFGYRNPITGDFSADYVEEVLGRDPFYSDALAELPDEQIYNDLFNLIEVELL